MHFIPVLLLLVLIGLWFLSTKIMRATVEALADPRAKIRLRSHVPSIEDMRAPLRHIENWADVHGYREDTMFDFWTINEEQSLFCKTWKNDAERTHLLFYFGMGKHMLEFVTIYDDKTGVTTTNSPDGHTLPAAPGAFIQSFPDTDPDQLLALHMEGRQTLERRTGLEPRPITEDTVELIIAALTRQARYITSIKGWKWRGLWWIVVRKRQMIAKNVAWQLDQFGVFEPAEPPSGMLQ